MNAKVKKDGFDAQLAQLQDIVEQLESEDLPLEKAYELFEKGIALHKSCRTKLDEIEKKIETLLADDPEAVTTATATAKTKKPGGSADEDEEIPF